MPNLTGKKSHCDNLKVNILETSFFLAWHSASCEQLVLKILVWLFLKIKKSNQSLAASKIKVVFGWSSAWFFMTIWASYRTKRTMLNFAWTKPTDFQVCIQLSSFIWVEIASVKFCSLLIKNVLFKYLDFRKWASKEVITCVVHQSLLQG